MPDPERIYAKECVLGRGTFGEVWRARHREEEWTAAIKILKLDPNAKNEEELEKEVQILRLCKSVFCVGYFGTYEKDDEIWIAMEYCPAGSVADLMDYCERTMQEDEIAEIVAFALLGLEFLHTDKGVFHRDVKAANLLFAHRGRIKLADFGVSAKLATHQSRAKTTLGTPFWMAPEVIEGRQPYKNVCDVWSLGITVLEMAEGKPPLHFMTPTRALFAIADIASRKKPPPTLAKPSLWSEDMRDFLKLCLRHDPETRPSAADLLTHPFVEERVRRIARTENTSALVARLIEENQETIEQGRTRRFEQ